MSSASFLLHFVASFFFFRFSRTRYIFKHVHVCVYFDVTVVCCCYSRQSNFTFSVSSQVDKTECTKESLLSAPLVMCTLYGVSLSSVTLLKLPSVRFWIFIASLSVVCVTATLVFEQNFHCDLFRLHWSHLALPKLLTSSALLTGNLPALLPNWWSPAHKLTITITTTFSLSLCSVVVCQTSRRRYSNCSQTNNNGDQTQNSSVNAWKFSRQTYKKHHLQLLSTWELTTGFLLLFASPPPSSFTQPFLCSK